MPEKVANSFIYEKWGKKIYDGIVEGSEKGLLSAISKAPLEVSKQIASLGKNFSQKLTTSVNESIKTILEKYKGNLAEALQKGTVQNEIKQAVLNNPMYQKMQAKVSGAYPSVSKEVAYDIMPAYAKLEKEVLTYPQRMIEKAESVINKNLIQIELEQQAKLGTIGKNVKNIPQSPNTLPAPSPVNPAQTVSPNLQQVPTMQPPQDVYGRLAQGLENLPSFGDTMKYARKNAPAAAMASFGGIPVAKTVAAGLGAAKAGEMITRPGAAANAVRATFKQAGIAAIDSWAQRYPSYNNGVLENPMERRSLTKEIESDQEIPIENKAVAISNVNRGKPIQSRL
jgi:hypothetical protein